VIKIEDPRVGDPMRQWGRSLPKGHSPWWPVIGRNKKSVGLDLRTSEGQAIARALIAQADVVIENFRPGVLERWGLDYESIKALNVGAILLRVSAYGQTGPMSDQPGFARIAHGFSGLAYLAGDADGGPVTPGSTSLADDISGFYGAIGVLLALRAREATGEGQCIDVALFESTFRVLDEIAPAFQQFGFVRERMGADTVNVVPHSHYETADGKWLAIACSNDEMFRRLATAMGRPELAGDDLYGPKEKRLAARPLVNAMVAEWVASRSRDDALAACRAAEVPAGPLYSIAEIFEDPQYQHRGTIVTADSRIGPLAVPGTLPALSGTPGGITWLGRALGADTDEVLGELLHRTADEIAELRTDGVV
jgi:crotonobetainyl-CoA:carnitine CoA-transferase CaiB-like acyl-CoA transferase